MKVNRRRTMNLVVSTIIGTLLVLSLCATTSVAAPTTFFGEDLGLGEGIRLPSHPNSDAARDAFFTQLTGVGVEDLESFADGTPAPITVDFGASGSATLEGGGYINEVPTGTNGFGRYPISGDNYWETGDEFS